MQFFQLSYSLRLLTLPCAVLFMFSIYSCKKLINIPPPSDKLVTTSVFASNATANQAVLSIYGKMAVGGESYFMSQNCGLLADEFINYSPSSLQINFYHNSMYSSMAPYEGCWANGYNYIYQANAIIEGMKNNTSVSSIVVSRLTGETKFIRAFWHFYLTLCYGAVPIAITTDYTITSHLSRSTREQVLKQIIVDLKDAISLSSDEFRDATDTVLSNERLRPTTWAAHALLARAYLYNKNYDSAAMEATKVIDRTTLFSLNPDLNQVFLANSTDAIWQNVYRLPDAINTYDGFNFILTSAPSGSRTVALSPLLLNSFETGDNRKTNWINSVSTPTVYYFPYKYKVQNGTNTDVHTEYVMNLRLSEQYLIRAEARAQNQNISGALDDLNAIRHRAGLADYAGAQDQASVLAAILHERQVELFTEWGHRWFDLARTGTINAVMDTVAPIKGGTWDTRGYQALFPIPQAERLANPNLTQNAGYN